MINRLLLLLNFLGFGSAGSVCFKPRNLSEYIDPKMSESMVVENIFGSG